MTNLPTSHSPLEALPLGAVQLGHGIDRHRRELTRNYLLSLDDRNLIQNQLIEAGLLQVNETPSDLYGGWEAPSSQVRGFFIGHWLSAAATLWATDGDTRLKGRLDHLVGELARCQVENGGEWVGSIPEKYLDWIRRGKAVWAPLYVVHKPLMGLLDAYTLANNEQALEIVVNAAKWFARFTDGMSTEQLDDLLDWETGGIHELWCDLYAITGNERHLSLVNRFDRRRLIDRINAGEDVLTNQHANQTIPEIMSAARAFEVTGETRWRDAVIAYWDLAVTNRGFFATGGQTFGEYWTPPFQLASRLGDSNQEHCVVYNMTRLAEKLLRWTGEPQYADYIERARVNGLYAQQHPQTGMVCYYLPLHAGGQKVWATPTESFWCCVGTQVQAGARFGQHAYYRQSRGLTITDYLPATVTWNQDGTTVTMVVTTGEDTPPPGKADFNHELARPRPNALEVDIQITADPPVEFDLDVRLPWWLADAPRLSIDGEPQALPTKAGSFAPIRRTWSTNSLRLELPTALTVEPLPDQPGTVAFMDGPRVLAGLVNERRQLHGDLGDPTTLLEPVAELALGRWQHRYSTRGQSRDFTLVPLNEVIDEPYTVYFPVTD